MAGRHKEYGLSGRCASIAAMIVLAGSLLLPHIVRAQNYPSRPVRLILPFGPGGVADVTARIVTEKLGEKLGQRFIIENMPGAGGINAARAVLSSAADGYTLALLSNGTAISVSLFKTLNFNPVTDFVPVSSMGYFDFIFVTKAGSPYRTLADFIKAAKQKPGELNVGTINVGSTQNLAAQLFKSTAGVDVTIVPFRSSPDVLIALLRGDIQMAIENYTAVQSHIADHAVAAVSSSGLVRVGHIGISSSTCYLSAALAGRVVTALQCLHGRSLSPTCRYHPSTAQEFPRANWLWPRCRVRARASSVPARRAPRAARR